MIVATRGLVLRSVKYGDTSLVSTIFTRTQGVQSYMTQGARSTKSKNNKASLLQPATLLDIVVYQKPNASLQRIKEMQLAHIYMHLQEDIVRNSIALFSLEVLLRLLPEHASLPELYDFAEDYFIKLDGMKTSALGNFPLYFLIKCSEQLGYSIRGNYSEETPYLHLHEGAFLQHEPVLKPVLHIQAAKIIDDLRKTSSLTALEKTEMTAAMRHHLLEWYLLFLQQHTQHFGTIKSLAVLQAVLH